MAKKTDRVQKFKREGGEYTSDAIHGAKAYWREIAKEGGWDSLDELISDYILPMAANRQAALDRWAKANGKVSTGVRKKSKAKAKAKSAKPRKARAAKAKPAASSESNHAAAAAPAE
jgi:hypothetical protein